MSLQTITPREAKRLLDGGGVLVDIREADEHARESIPGARHFRCRGWTRRTLRARRGRSSSSIVAPARAQEGNSARLAARSRTMSCEAFLSRAAWRHGERRAAADRQLRRGLQPLFVDAGLLFAALTGFCTWALCAGDSGNLIRPDNDQGRGHMSAQMVQDALGLFSGSLVGFSLGLVGGGGSILAVPLMIYLVGVPSAHIAIGTSALAVCGERGRQCRIPRAHGKREVALRRRLRGGRCRGRIRRLEPEQGRGRPEASLPFRDPDADRRHRHVRPAFGHRRRRCPAEPRKLAQAPSRPDL